MAAYKYVDENKKQYQIEYITYMIFASLFKKATCVSSYVESSLLLYYKELGQKAQLDIESSVIYTCDNILTKFIDISDFEDIELKVKICPTPNNHHYFMFYNDNGFRFVVAPTMNYEKHQIDYVVEYGKKDKQIYKFFAKVK